MRDIKDLIAEVYGVVWTTDRQIKDLERFAELVARAEREACALMCEEFELLHVAEAIRYREKHKEIT
jgi:hypothetical protein